MSFASPSFASLHILRYHPGMQNETLRIGIDIGGTFTDFVVYNPASGTFRTFKLLSTPANPAEAVLQGLQRIREDEHFSSMDIIHGSTVATNALLERKGTATALVTSRGFKDVLQIGRQNRPVLYDLFADPPAPLVPSRLRFEVDERVDHNGSILKNLESADVDKVAGEVARSGVKSAAVCLLFSFLHPAHEQLIAARLREEGLQVSLSSEILPEFREYERMSTTSVNAYVSPALDHYLGSLQNSLPEDATLRVMQSNGGSISMEEARRFGARCILSGPAGGVVGCDYVARSAFSGSVEGIRLITFDMGGTSTDVSTIEGSPQITTEAVVGGCPIRIPQLDIHTIGAGGGSIARVDLGGSLQVGPESATADPGPACYSRGGELPTVTDANLVLGRLQADYFLGGQMPLNFERAFAALSRLGECLGLDPIQAALGVVQVVNAHMERALQVISVERGLDPRGFSLLSFGGAGSLHAADLARGLRIPCVLVPPMASTLSAFGMLAAEVVKDYTQTVMLPGDTPLLELAGLLKPLSDRGKAEVQAEGVAENDICLFPSLDLRYQGQSYELVVPFSEHVFEDFHMLHEKQYGYSRKDGRVEVVNLRLRAVGKTSPPVLPRHPLGGQDASSAKIGSHQVVFTGEPYLTPLYRAELLQAGNRLQGPAVIVRSDTTILLGMDDHAAVDGYGNLLIEVAQ
jgi:N-methylhydantoinase A